jgi:elongation factor Tu
MAAPGSLAAHTRFTASVLLLATSDGGRRTPIASGYRPQFFFRTASVSGVVDLGEEAIALPGDRLTLGVELGRPVALGPGLGFVIREGGKTVGAGTVISVLS